MPFTGSTGLVVHYHGLIGLRKAISESRLGYLYMHVWCAKAVLECNFNVKLYRNWISVVVPTWTVLLGPVTIIGCILHRKIIGGQYTTVQRVIFPGANFTAFHEWAHYSGKFILSYCIEFHCGLLLQYLAQTQLCSDGA